MSLSSQQLIEQIKRNDTNRRLLDMLPDLHLPQAMLTAGCLFQTIWNLKSNNPPDWGIRDYDLFYFCDGDLSWEAEDAVIQRAKGLLGPLADKVQIRNQARVHLWYSQKFGGACPQLTCATDGIDRFLIAGTKLGICIETGTVHSPNGFEDMENGHLRINPSNPQPDRFLSKCQDYKARWPWLSIVG